MIRRCNYQLNYSSHRTREHGVLNLRNRSILLAFEGIDGAGKTTHLQWLRQYFTDRGRRVVATREPGGTPLGEDLRELVLHSEYPIQPETEALLMFAARREHLERLIQPALAAGDVVLCDRFTDATVAYQGFGRGVNVTQLEILEQWVQGGLQPNLTLYFDVPVHVGQQRMDRGQPRDRFEREPIDFFWGRAPRSRCREG